MGGWAGDARTGRGRAFVEEVPRRMSRARRSSNLAADLFSRTARTLKATRIE